ncbi:hypothetical protein D3C78_973410 [compost metagenome]
MKINDQSALSTNISLVDDLEMARWKAEDINRTKVRKIAAITIGMMLVSIAIPDAWLMGGRERSLRTSRVSEANDLEPFARDHNAHGVFRAGCGLLNFLLCR